MNNDVTDAFGDWKEPIIAVRNPGNYVNGRWVEGTPEQLLFSGVVQNASEADLKVLPEGNRASEAIKIHTTFDLIVGGGVGSKGDIISYKGSSWKVSNVARRFIGNYNKVILVKQ